MKGHALLLGLPKLQRLSLNQKAWFIPSQQVTSSY